MLLSAAHGAARSATNTRAKSIANETVATGNHCSDDGKNESENRECMGSEELGKHKGKKCQASGYWMEDENPKQGTFDTWLLSFNLL